MKGDVVNILRGSRYSKTPVYRAPIYRKPRFGFTAAISFPQIGFKPRFTANPDLPQTPIYCSCFLSPKLRSKSGYYCNKEWKRKFSFYQMLAAGTDGAYSWYCYCLTTQCCTIMVVTQVEIVTLNPKPVRLTEWYLNSNWVSKDLRGFFKDR